MKCYSNFQNKVRISWEKYVLSVVVNSGTAKPQSLLQGKILAINMYMGWEMLKHA